MSDTVKLYVVGPVGKFIPGHGSRQPGQWFEMPEAEAITYVGYDGFSLKDPTPKPTPKRASKSKTDEEA